MECLNCMDPVPENIRLCDICLDKSIQEKRMNYTLMKCWYCSGPDSTKSKKDGMCNVCKHHKAATKYLDEQIGINPNYCYCCDEQGVLEDHIICAYCGRTCCNDCGELDEKQLITCIPCHPPKLGIKNGTMIKFVSDSININDSVYIPNYIKWCMKANHVEFKKNDNNKRKSPSLYNYNKKQKK